MIMVTLLTILVTRLVIPVTLNSSDAAHAFGDPSHESGDAASCFP